MSLNLNHVSKSFPQGPESLVILQDLSLAMRTGERLAIIGESGSGKSTLLSIVAGFESIDSGQIRFGDVDAGSWDDQSWATFRRKNLGFVFQNYHLIPYLTAAENIALPLRLCNISNTDELAETFLDQLGLRHRAGHLPAQLSGGERQRVAIGRALIHKPQVVLADEPTGSLDVKTAAQVLDILFGVLQERGQTAMVVTHSMEVAARCDRILVLREGRLCSP